MFLYSIFNFLVSISLIRNFIVPYSISHILYSIFNILLYPILYRIFNIPYSIFYCALFYIPYSILYCILFYIPCSIFHIQYSIFHILFYILYSTFYIPLFIIPYSIFYYMSISYSIMSYPVLCATVYRGGSAKNYPKWFSAESPERRAYKSFTIPKHILVFNKKNE